MNIEEIQKFICRIAKDKIVVRFANIEELKDCSGFPIWITSDHIIHINKKQWNKLANDELYQYFLLLHEIGHIKDPSPYYSSVVERELYAQLWAMKKAKALKNPALYRYIRSLLGIWEYTYEWNSDHRKFILASRLAKQRGLV